MRYWNGLGRWRWVLRLGVVVPGGGGVQEEGRGGEGELLEDGGMQLRVCSALAGAHTARARDQMEEKQRKKDEAEARKAGRPRSLLTHTTLIHAVRYSASARKVLRDIQSCVTAPTRSQSLRC